MRFTKDALLPSLSFRYGGRQVGDCLTAWPGEDTSRAVPGGSETTSLRRDSASGLVVRVIARHFDRFDAVDWLVEFENAGTSDTPILEDILPLDVTVPFGAYDNLRLHHANGSLCLPDDFLPQTTALMPHTEKRLAPLGGRSSNGTLPFMNLQGPDSGLVLAVGWSGQWAATFKRDSETLQASAGMDHTHLYLKPGERIRTPRILALPWDGKDADFGNNLLRRLLLEHYLPRIDSELVMPPSAQCLQSRFYLTGEAGEAVEMAALPRVADLGFEAYWVDACWYGTHQEWWAAVGSWSPNPQRFPNGLRPISDAAHARGMQFVLWFEPERVRTATDIELEHPEYILRHPDSPDNHLFNLGMPEARAYLTDLISDAITEHGIDIYRNDFNIDPLPFWQLADTPDRVGMTEIRYVEGLYAFWDELRRRHPQMWIDNCASGGRRIDLETCSRSLPLWPSDFPDIGGLATGMGLHVGDQCINAGLARWVPFFGGGLWNMTPYGSRSEIMGGFTLGYHIEHSDLTMDDAPGAPSWRDALRHGVTVLDDDFPFAAAHAAVAEHKSIRPYFTGDFYPLLPITARDTDWCAWQLHREDLAAGIALLFRRHRSPFPTMQLSLRAIDPHSAYDVSLSPYYEEAPRRRMTGVQLQTLTISIDQMPGSLLLRYTRVP